MTMMFFGLTVLGWVGGFKPNAYLCDFTYSSVSWPSSNAPSEGSTRTPKAKSICWEEAGCLGLETPTPVSPTPRPGALWSPTQNSLAGGRGGGGVGDDTVIPTVSEQRCPAAILKSPATPTQRQKQEFAVTSMTMSFLPHYTRVTSHNWVRTPEPSP